MILYDYLYSSACMRVRLACAILGVSYDSYQINLSGKEQFAESYVAINPQARLPLLQIGKDYISQSLAILEYLSECHGNTLLPDDPIERAQARALAYVIAVDTHPLCNFAVAEFAQSASQGKISSKEWLTQFMTSGLGRFEAMLRQRPQLPYSFGKKITFPDICLAPQMASAHRLGIVTESFPLTHALYERLQAEPTFNTVLS